MFSHSLILCQIPRRGGTRSGLVGLKALGRTGRNLISVRTTPPASYSPPSRSAPLVRYVRSEQGVCLLCGGMGLRICHVLRKPPPTPLSTEPELHPYIGQARIIPRPPKSQPRPEPKARSPGESLRTQGVQPATRLSCPVAPRCNLVDAVSLHDCGRAGRPGTTPRCPSLGGHGRLPGPTQYFDVRSPEGLFRFAAFFLRPMSRIIHCGPKCLTSLSEVYKVRGAEPCPDTGPVEGRSASPGLRAPFVGLSPVLTIPDNACVKACPMGTKETP